MACLVRIVFRSALCLVIPVALILGACVFPTQLAEEPPFGEDVTGSVQLGVTRKPEVRDLIGDPPETYANGRWWVYHSNRRMAEWFWFFCAQTGCGGGAFGEGERRYSLVAEFDEAGLLQETIVVDEKQPCARDNSICYRKGQLELAWSSDSSLPDFPATCSLILYGRTPALPFSSAWIRIDGAGASTAIEYRHTPTNRSSSNVRTHVAGAGSAAGTLTDTTHLHMPLREGSYVLRVIFPVMGESTEPIQLECLRGETHFVRLLYEAPSAASFTRVEPPDSRADIRGRALRLLRDESYNY